MMLLSFGDLSLSENITISQITEHDLTFTWDTKLTENGHDRDQAMMVAYDVENKSAFYATVGAFRCTGTDTLQIEGKKGRTYEVYFAFCAANRASQSNSIYLGAVSV